MGGPLKPTSSHSTSPESATNRPPRPTVITPARLPPGSPAPRVLPGTPPAQAAFAPPPLVTRTAETPQSFYFRDIKLLTIFFLYLTALSYAFDFNTLNHITVPQLKFHAFFFARVLLLTLPASLLVAITTHTITYQTPLKEIFAKITAITFTNFTISYLTIISESLVQKYLTEPVFKAQH